MSVVNLKGRKPQRLWSSEVYIGRSMYMGGWSLEGSKWANPFLIDTSNAKRDGSRSAVLRKYETYIRNQPDLMAALSELEGKTLACWCKPEGCHGDVLIKLVRERSNAE